MDDGRFKGSKCLNVLDCNKYGTNTGGTFTSNLGHVETVLYNSV